MTANLMANEERSEFSFNGNGIPTGQAQADSRKLEEIKGN